LSELCYLAQNLTTSTNVDPFGGLIKKQNICIFRNQPPSQQNLLLIAARQLPDALGMPNGHYS
jgi:hypothetical protein